MDSQTRRILLVAALFACFVIVLIGWAAYMSKGKTPALVKEGLPEERERKELDAIVDDLARFLNSDDFPRDGGKDRHALAGKIKGDFSEFQKKRSKPNGVQVQTLQDIGRELNQLTDQHPESSKERRELEKNTNDFYNRLRQFCEDYKYEFPWGATSTL